jgi:hypothetical protein
MKKENVTLADCKFSLYHRAESGLDGVYVEIKVSELSQIQRLIAKVGGRIDLFNTALELNVEAPEILTWISYSHYGTVNLMAQLNISLEQYNLMLAAFGGNNSVDFVSPQVLTLINDTYLVLPDDVSQIRRCFRESQSAAIEILKD